MNASLKIFLAVAIGAGIVASAAANTPVRKSTAPTPATQGIEPDEIDARQRAATPPARAERVTRPARKPPVTTVPVPGKFAPAVDPEGKPQAYETADCSNEQKSITCCTNTGEGGSCNLFILLCEENGGTGKGDAGDAICVH